MNPPTVIRLHPTQRRANSIQELFAGKISAVVMEGVLHREQCETTIKHIQNSNIQRPLFPQFLVAGGMLMFAESKSGYFQQNQNLQMAIASLPIWECLAKAFQRLEIVVKPYCFPNGQPAAPFNVRELKPGGEIAVHSEHDRWPFMDELATNLDLSTQLSFYVQLQPVVDGGQLEFVEATPNCPSWSISQPLPIALNHGDLIVFDGGRINHRVTKNQGPKSRWSLGGFGSVTDNVIYLWG